MGRPQQPELERSGRTPVDPDAVPKHAPRHAPDDPGTGPGPVPEDNRPGHHPDHDQDQPDLDAFAERLGIPSDDEHSHDEHGSSADPADRSRDTRASDEVTPAPSAVTPDAATPADTGPSTGRGGSPSPTQALAGTAVGAARLVVSVPLRAMRLGVDVAGASLRAVRRVLPGSDTD